MAIQVVTTARVDKRKIADKINAIRLTADKSFTEEAMDLKDVGQQTLAFLKSIFPKSPASYPSRRRAPLVNVYRLYMFPPKQGEQGRAGFVVRPAPSSTADKDAETIRALDLGSRAYQRHYGRGQVGSIFVTNPQMDGRPGVAIGDTLFFTGDGIMLQFKAREGRHFINRTLEFARGLIAEARQRYKREVKKKADE